MRINKDMQLFFKQEVQKINPEARVYLFGSRTDDTKKGGDIDILILSPEKIDMRKIIQLRVKLYQQFGEQKLDVVNFTYHEQSPLKDIILEDAILL